MPNSSKYSLSNQNVRFILFVLILIIMALIGRQVDVDVEYYREILNRYPLALSGLIYIVLYVFFTMLIVWGPKDVFRISGALLFGPVVSTVLVYIAEMVNLVLLFNLSRRLGRGFVMEKMKVKEEKMAEIQKDLGWFNVFTLRLNPLVPYRFLDLAYGLTRISFRKYFMVALAASPPRIFWLQYILAGIGMAALKDFNVMLQYFLENPTVFFLNGLYILLVMVLSLIAVIRNFVKRKKAE